MIKVISIREKPEYAQKAIAYFQKSWPFIRPEMYTDGIGYSIQAKNALPQWYLLENKQEIIGCAGLITNDLISRAELYPWICALFIAEDHRGNGYASLLIEKAKEDAKAAGFEYVYLSTEMEGYYEKHGFAYIGDGYHPWGEASRIYEFKLQ